MDRAWIKSALVAVVALLTSACSYQPPPRGTLSSTDRCVVSAPVRSASLRQGEQQTFTINLERGSDFRRSVNLQAAAPLGLKATLNNTRVTPDEAGDVTLTITAAPDAALGNRFISFAAIPEDGIPATMFFRVRVE